MNSFDSLDPDKSFFYKAFYLEAQSNNKDEVFVSPIAITLKINKKNQTVEWGDTMRGKMIHYSSVKIEPSRITILDNEDTKYVFEFLTKEIFNKNKLNERVLPIPESKIQTDRELQSFFLAKLREH